jgi:hypothetical protein
VVHIINHSAVNEAFLTCMDYTILSGSIVKKWRGYERKKSAYFKVLLQLSLARIEEIRTKPQSE